MERTTIYGKVAGLDESATSGALAWKGIPFARAPVGELRWRAPVEPDGWSGVRPARDFGPACVQIGRLYGPGRNNRYDRSIGECLGQVTGSEDCLYLNIWAPATAEAPLPVIVFIHGGSNITGYTADPVYDGARLAVTGGAVVVTVNYRLGIFGFFDLPQKFDNASGNFALLDIVAALKFVNRNIAAFGGDPGNVTLMGQSAGAVNIWALLTSPLLTAEPALVQRALPISGSVAMTADLPQGCMGVLHPPALYSAQGAAVLRGALTRAGAATPQNSGDWLRAQSAESLLHVVLEELTPLGLATSGPIADGLVVAAAPLAAIRAGNWRRVPLLAGFTRDEGKLFPAMLALSPMLGGASGRLIDDATVFELLYCADAGRSAQTALDAWIPPQLLPAAAPVTGFNERMRQLDALLFHPNRDAMLDAVRAQQDQVWFYQFDWDEEAPPFDTIYGAAHGFDVPFLFGNFGPSVFATVINSSTNQAGRLALSNAMMRAVGAFARHGDPNHAALGTHWPAWPAMLHFDADDALAVISVSGAQS
ncbi:MAG: carboxylesterase [Massilia sp.]|nr:carboxylesterase [Massilia sp.]